MSASRPAPWSGLVAALGFLTVLPVGRGPAARGHTVATAFFPLVGALLGLSAVCWLALPLPPTVGAVLAVGFMAVLTGGLHWDGWADIMDAGLADASRERRREILSDPRVGAHATWGVGILLLLQVAVLSQAPLWAAALGPTFSRWGMVATLRLAPVLGSGTAARFRSEARLGMATVCLVAVVVLVIPAFGGGFAAVLVALASAGACGALFAYVLVRRFGGLNGDGHGAVGLLTETSVWLFAATFAAGAG